MMVHADVAAEARLREVRAIVDAALEGMRRTLADLGLEDELEPMRIDTASFSLSPDPADGGESLTGVWKDGHGHHAGSITVHADTSFYAEFGLAVPHPRRSGWFIDAATSWGRDGIIKAELRLLPVL
jgi:hypothetical protein